MAPHITVPPDLADRFPDLVAALQPREFRGRVRVVSHAANDREIAALLDWMEDAPSRRSGFMLPGGVGGAVETIRADYKSRLDVGLPPSIVWTKPVRRAVGWAPPLDRALLGAYGVGDHFGWHRDDMLPDTERRDLAVVVALNDDYEGGHLELPEAGLSLRLPKGAGVVFPASALHRVTPVTRGVRRVLLTFTLRDDHDDR